MEQHRALRAAGSAAGVLEEEDVVAGERDRLERQRRALGEYVGQAQRRGQPRVDRGRGHGKAAAVAEVERDHRLNRGLVDDLGQRRGGAAEDDDGLDAGVVQLVGELARRVERVDVHLRRAGPQDAEHHDREGRHVRRHQRHAVAAADAELLLQVGGHRTRSAVDLGVGHGRTKALEGRQVGEARDCGVEARDDRGIGVSVDLDGDAVRAGLDPGHVHRGSSHLFRGIAAGCGLNWHRPGRAGALLHCCFGLVIDGGRGGCRGVGRSERDRERQPHAKPVVVPELGAGEATLNVRSRPATCTQSPRRS